MWILGIVTGQPVAVVQQLWKVKENVEFFYH
jgi:hypothetical protein